MQAQSRQARAAAVDRLEALVASSGADPASLAEELFGVTGVLGQYPALRRALTDSSRDGDAKAALLERVVGGGVSRPTLDLLSGLVHERWSQPGDLVDTVEDLAVLALAVQAERAGRLSEVEDELFRFGRTVAGDGGLRDALATPVYDTAAKAELVRRLLAGRGAPETVRLAVQAATAPRGLRSERAITRYVEVISSRQRQLLAEVVAATPLSEQQRERLAASLRRAYGQHVRLNVDVDPQVVGGLRVRIGGEVLDGTVASRLSEARRRLAG